MAEEVLKKNKMNFGLYNTNATRFSAIA